MNPSQFHTGFPGFGRLPSFPLRHLVPLNEFGPEVRTPATARIPVLILPVDPTTRRVKLPLVAGPDAFETISVPVRGNYEDFEESRLAHSAFGTGSYLAYGAWDDGLIWQCGTNIRRGTLNKSAWC